MKSAIAVAGGHQLSSASPSLTLEAVADLANLHHAWSRVAANRGGPGGDGETIESFSERASPSLEKLSEELLSQRYRPGPLRTVTLRKPGRKQRKLRVPSVRDRVAQTAVLNLMAPLVDGKMSDASWGYRAGRGVKHALARVREIQKAGLNWTVDADITDCFDRIPHRRLIQELSIWFEDEKLLGLIGLWLRRFGWCKRGIAQGAPISPLLANLYLHPLDRLVTASGFPIVRYADDFVIMAGSANEAKRGLALVRDILNSRGLDLNMAKTRIREPNEAFVFLGEQVVAPVTVADSLDRNSSKFIEPPNNDSIT